MKDREDFSKVIADISILFELSLAVGQSLDLQTNCDRFLKTLMARKNLGYSSVWIKGEYLVDLPEEILLEDRDENSAFLVYANPEFRIKEKSIPPHHLIFSMLEGKEAFSIASTEDRFSEIITEKGIDKGIFAIFSLGKLGFLKLFSMMRETPFGKEELNQLNNVVSKFTISLEGCIAHQKVVRDITERKRAEEALRRSEEEARRLAQENALVAEVGRIIGSTPNIDEVFERFSKAVAELIPFDRIVINLRGPQEDDSFVRYVAGIDVPNRRAGEYVPLTGTATAECMRTKSSLLIQPKDVKEIEEWVARFPKFLPNFEAGIRSAILAPLIAEDQVIGVLSLRTTKTKAYADQDVRLTESIASQIAGAVANAQLYIERTQAEEAARRSEEEARRLAQENALVAEVGKILSSTFDLKEVYEGFAAEMRKLIPFDRIAMNVIDPKSYTFTIPYVSGMQVTDRREGEVIPLAGTGTEEIMRTQRSIFIHEENREAIISRLPGLIPIIKAGFQSIIMVPLISKNEVIAVINIQSNQPGAYTQDDLRLAERISSQIAGAIANAQLFVQHKRTEEALKKAYDELKETQAQLIQAEKAEVIGRLATGVAHEVKNPLAIIMQGIDYLSANVPLDKANVSLTLKHINDAVMRADNITKGLLSFSSEQEMKKMPENLNSIIESSLLFVKNLLDKYHIEVIKEFGKDIPSLNLDKSRIEQVFLNLFLNAIDAMPGGGQLKVKTYNKTLTGVQGEIFKPGEKAVTAEIEDTGTGIPADIMDKIFDPFFTTKRDKGGTGLGLPIVRNIVEMHNGEIKVETIIDRSGVRVTLVFKE